MAHPSLHNAANSEGQVVCAGVQIELATVGWMTIEAVVAIVAGILARSVLLTAFGLDSSAVRARAAPPAARWTAFHSPIDASSVAFTLIALYEGVTLIWVMAPQVTNDGQRLKDAHALVLAGL